MPVFNSISMNDEEKSLSLTKALSEYKAEFTNSPVDNYYITFETYEDGIPEDLAKIAYKLCIIELEYRYYSEERDILGSLVINGNKSSIEHLIRSEYWKQRQSDKDIKTWMNKCENKVQEILEQYQDSTERLAQWESFWDETAYPEFRNIEPYEWEIQDIPNDMFRDMVDK